MKQIYFIAALSAAYLSPALPATAASGPIPLLKGSVLSSQAWDEDNPAQGKSSRPCLSALPALSVISCREIIISHLNVFALKTVTLSPTWSATPIQAG